MYHSLNLPIELSQQIIQKDLLKPYQIYLSLKFLHNGQVRISDIDYQKISDLSGYKDARTIKAHLDTCLSLNWIGSDNEWYFIRSFDRLRKDIEATSRTAIEISKKDIPNLLELLLSAKIEHRARSKRYARKKSGAKPETIEPNSDFSGNGNDFGLYKVSCSLIADWFSFSPSTATRIKQRAKKIGYLDYIHDYKKTGLHRRNIADLSDHIEPTRLFIKNGQICIRLTDRFIITGEHHIYKFKSRKSIELQNVQ